MTPARFHCPTRIVLGVGARREVREACGPRRTLLVCSAGQWERMQASADPWWPEDPVVWAEVRENPDLDPLDAAAAALRGAAVEVVLAVGGGSAMDAAKALAAALGTGGSLSGWLREGAPIPQEGWLPVVAVPTTAGTGSEVTPYATIWDRAQGCKRSLSGPPAFPVAALVDPELMVSVPAPVTLSTGLDAFNQALESVWNRHCTAAVLPLAARAMALAWDALPRAMADGADVDARARMAEASTLAGLCIAQTRTALCHAMSYPLTLHLGVPHGLACAFPMAAVWDLCVAEDDGRLAEVLRLANLGAAATFGDRLRAWLVSVGLPAALARHLPANPAPVLALVDEMFAPGRAENLMVAVDATVVEAMVHSSVRAWTTTGVL